LEVYQIGESVEGISVGDMVYLPKNAIERCDLVEVEGTLKLMVSDFDIAIIW
jgi:hypothetical protein